MTRQKLSISTFTINVPWKLYVVIDSNPSFYPTGTKNIPVCCCLCNMARIGHTASEEKSFENVDGRWMDAGCKYILKAHI